MSDVKKFYLVSEHDYTLLRKAKGEEISPLPPHSDIDVRNNIKLNKRLTAMTTNAEAEKNVNETDSVPGGGQAKMDETSLDDQIKSESVDDSFLDISDIPITSKETFLEDLRGYLSPKVADKGEMLALRIFAIPKTVLNGKDQSVTFDGTVFSLSQLREFIMFCMTRKKPPNDEYLSEIAVYLSKHGVPSTMITNPYMKTRMIIAETPSKLGAFAKMQNRSPMPFKWYSSMVEADDDDVVDDS